MVGRSVAIVIDMATIRLGQSGRAALGPLEVCLGGQTGSFAPENRRENRRKSRG